jgi:hypothetical protein
MHQISHLFARFEPRAPLICGPAPARPCATRDSGASQVAGRFS